MDVDDFLREYRPLDAPVDVDAALTATLARGRARRRRRVATSVVLIGALLLVGGTALAVANRDRPAKVSTIDRDEPGSPPDPGTWTIDPNAPPTSSATSFRALVNGIRCNSGRTVQPRTPEVTIEPSRIVITFTLQPHLPVGNGETCPGSPPVPYEVELGTTIGGRRLVDSTCREGAEGSGSGLCEDAGVRWSSPSADASFAPDSLIIATTDGRILETGSDGAERRSLAQRARGTVDGLALHPDRTRVFVGVRGSGRPDACNSSIEEVRLDGISRTVTTGAYPAVSADGRSLAFGQFALEDGICRRTAIGILDLASSGFRLREFELSGPGTLADSRADLPLSWSADGAHIALVHQGRIALLDVSEPGQADLEPVAGAPTTARLPTFERPDRLIASCCTGPVRLVYIDRRAESFFLASGFDGPLVALSRGVAPGYPIGVTAEGRLLSIDTISARVLRNDVLYADN